MWPPARNSSPGDTFPPIPFPIFFSNDGRYLLVQANRRSPLDELLILVKAITKRTSTPYVECVDIETNQVVGKVNHGLYLGINAEDHLLTCQGNSIEEYELPLKAHYSWMVYVCIGCVLFAIPLLLPFRWVKPLIRRRSNEVTAINKRDDGGR